MAKRFAPSTPVASGLISLSLSSVLCLTVHAADATVKPTVTVASGADKVSVEKRSRWTNAARAASDALDRNDGMTFISDVDDENLDVWARAIKALLFKDAQGLPAPRGSLPNRFAMEALVTNERVGCTEVADTYAALLTTDPGSNGFTRLDYPIRTLEQKLTRACLSAIANNDKAQAVAAADNLLQSYRAQSDMKDPRRFTLRRQNTFCTTLNIARKFSDHGWYQQSDALMTKLLQASIDKSDWTVANGFISIEQGINSLREAAPGKSAGEKHPSRPDRNAHFQKALAELGFTQHVEPRPNGAAPPNINAYDYTVSEKFRRLAVAYYWAGDLDRAALLINCAMSAYDEMDAHAPDLEIVHYPQDGLRGDNILLNLDAACLAARQSKFDQAKKYIAAVLAGPALINPSYGAKIAELASIYEKNQRLDEAIVFLQALRDKKMVAPDRQPRSYLSGPFLVDYWLARLLFADNKIAKARQVIDSAINQTADTAAPGLPRRSDCSYGPAVLAGNCAFALQDFKAAALHYEEAGMARRYGALPVSDESSLNHYWLQKAIDCFKQTPSIAAEDKARILAELATSIMNQEPKRAFDLDKSATELLDDSNPKKAALLAEMGRLQEMIDQTAAGTNMAAATLAAATSPTTAPASIEAPPTVTSNNDAQLALLRQAATLSEQNNEPLAANRFYALAQVEARVGLLAKAKANYLHAVGLYKKGVHFGAFRSISGLVGSSDEVIQAFVRQERIADAVAIFQAAVIKLQSTDGAASAIVAGQWLDFMQFYIDRQDDANALNCLDKFLACDMHNFDASTSVQSFHGPGAPSIKVPCHWARSVASNNQRLAMTILDKILAAQQKQLNDDDFRLVETILTLGDVQHAIGLDATAAESYKKAFDIYKLYYGEEKADRWITKQYLEVLQKLCNTAEYERLDAIKKRPYQPPVRPQRQHGDRQTANLDDYTAEYIRLKDDAPYSSEARGALNIVISTARAQQKWSTAIQYSLKQIALARHLQDKPAVIERYERNVVDLYVQSGNLDEARKYSDKQAEAKSLNAHDLAAEQTTILQAYIKSDQLATASSYIARLWKNPSIDSGGMVFANQQLIEAFIKADRKVEAKSELHKFFEYRGRWITTFEPLYVGLSIAKLAVDLDETKYLPQLLSRAEEILPKDRGNFYLLQIADLWQKIGDEKHADVLREKFKTFMATQPPPQGLRPFRPDPEQGQQSREQTKVGRDFPAAATPANYCFNFAALAGNSITFEQNARLNALAVNFTATSIVENQLVGLALAGSYGKLTAAQTANHSGELSFIAGSAPGTIQNVIPMPHNSGGGGSSGISIRLIDLPAVSAMPFKAALKPPAQGACGQVDGMMGTGLQIGLSPGDYKSSGLGVDALYAKTPGRLRIFLGDASVGNTPVFHAQPNSLINAKAAAGPAPEGCTLEFWYEGTGTIKLGRDSTFNGLIYAPNARVEIGPGQATFCGAIVAKDILVSGDSRVFYDPTLAKWKQD